jgi:hypothetical protein
LRVSEEGGNDDEVGGRIEGFGGADEPFVV